MSNAPYITSAPTKDEHVALVASGPGLEETWEELKNYKTIFTCSRAHDRLIAKGIIPTYHVDVDPREGKHELVTPHKGVTYLLHSYVHQNYWDKVKDHPHYQFFIDGTQAGDIMLRLVRYMGYVNIHCYGYDACGSGNELFTFDGKQYLVDENLLGSIHQFENALWQSGGIQLGLHGNGLLKAYLEKKYGTRQN